MVASAVVNPVTVVVREGLPVTEEVCVDVSVPVCVVVPDTLGLVEGVWVLDAVTEGVLEGVESAVLFPVVLCVTDRVGVALAVPKAVPLCVPIGLRLVDPDPVCVTVELVVPVNVLVTDFVWEAVP